MTETQITEYFDLLLETEDMENVLERYDLAPTEVLVMLWTQGLIQEDYPNEEENYDQ